MRLYGSGAEALARRYPRRSQSAKRCEVTLALPGNNYLVATSLLAQTTLRWVLGKHDLDTMLAERDKLNADIQDVLDKQTEAWGRP